LFETFLADLPANGDIRFWKQHDWYGKFHDSSTDQIDNYIRRWSVPEFEFLDTTLEFKRRKLNGLINEFLNFVLVTQDRCMFGSARLFLEGDS